MLELHRMVEGPLHGGSVVFDLKAGTKSQGVYP